MRRVAPAILLTVLAPIIAEFLLGDFSIRQIGIALVLLPLYGGGALLVREIARRARLGWPSIVLLGLAYALIEEGFLTQSLFNPDYAGHRLLDYGYLPWMGTSLNWCVLVLSIHVVWSIATPILIAEGVAGRRRTEPWLRTPGVVVTVLLFLLGCALTVMFSLQASPFVATRVQFTCVGALTIVVIVAAFLVGRRSPAVPIASERLLAAPGLPTVFVACLTLALGFMYADIRVPGVPPSAIVLVRLTLEVLAAVVILRWGKRRAWAHSHYLAIAAATTTTYAVFGLATFVNGQTHLGKPTGGADIVGQIVIAALVLMAIWHGARRAGE
jgi:hypothetical protein